MPLIKNKKVILFFGCLVIFFPGAFVFGFPGVMAAHWQEVFHVNKEQIGKIMFFILAGTGFSMYAAGKLQEKIPGQFLIFIGSLICALAMIFAGFAKDMTHIYIWAFLEGFFCGFIYIPCMTIFQKLFPENRGFVIGIFNLTFGGSSAVMSPLFTYLLVSKGYEFTTYSAAFCSLIIAIGASLFITPAKESHTAESQKLTILSFIDIIKMHSFWRLWGVWALAGASGISLIVLASSFGEYSGYGITQYVYILTCFNVFNGIGRIICGKLADHYSKQKILMTIFFMASITYMVMPWLDNIYLISFLACFIGLAFGGMFTVSAPLVTEVFGLENFGRIFGLVFTAYGFFAGLLGPWLSGVILDITNLNFKIVFSMFATFYLVAIFLISGIRKSKG